MPASAALERQRQWYAALSDPAELLMLLTTDVKTILAELFGQGVANS
jgi:hypothetical protein